METNKDKKVIQIKIDDEVKKLTIEGIDKNQQVIMREELSEDDLDNVTGGVLLSNPLVAVCNSVFENQLTPFTPSLC